MTKELWMSFYAYRPNAFDHTHENKFFNILYDRLKSNWESKPDQLHLLGNFLVNGQEIDALIIKNNAIIVIDFKDYGGNIHFSENNSWKADNIIIKGGNQTNPFHQIKNNKFYLLNFFKTKLSLATEPNYGHIAGLCLFHQPINFDELTLPAPIRRWFHISDIDRVIRTIDEINSTEINLTNNEIITIIETLDVPIYLPHGSAPQTHSIPTDHSSSKHCLPSDKLTNNQKDILSYAIEWLKNDDVSAFSIAGPHNSGKKTLLSLIHKEMLQLKKNVIFLAPNARIAQKYHEYGFRNICSIYQWLYHTNRIVRDQIFEYPLRNLKDIKNDIFYPNDKNDSILVFLDSHLFGNSHFETDTVIYGSGNLQEDLSSFLQNNFPKMLMIGDPYQLSRGATTESLLFEHFFIKNDIRFYLHNLTEQITNNPIVDFQFPLVSSLSQKKFTHLPDKDHLNPSIHYVNKGDNTINITLALAQWPKHSIYLTAKNDDVFKVNKWVRNYIFKTADMAKLVENDIILIENRPMTLNDVSINSGAFAKVLEISPLPEIFSITLKGRKHPILLEFTKIVIMHENKVAHTLMLNNYLKSDSNEITTDELIALQVLGIREAKKIIDSRIESQKDESSSIKELYTSKDLDEWRNRIKDINDKKEKDKQQELYKKAKEKYKEAFDEELLKSPYLNAARVRYGYAITVHKAQNYNTWTNIYLNAISSHDTENPATDSYFRWLYTATCCVESELHLINFPELNPLKNTHWNASSTLFVPINLKLKLNLAESLPLNFIPSPEIDVSNIFLLKLDYTLQHCLLNSTWTIESAHLEGAYALKYNLSNEHHAFVSLKFSFNKKEQVTLQEINANNEIQTEIKSLLKQPYIYKYENIRQGIHELESYLKASNWQLIDVDEKSEYKVFAIFRKDRRDVKLDININGKGLISTINIESANNRTALELFKQDINYDC